MTTDNLAGVTLADDLDLPFEEDDVSATEPHNALAARILFGLRYRLPGTLVLGDIFVRRGRQQASPDVFTVPGGERGARRVYRLEQEPRPEVTIEVISATNKTDVEAIAQLQRKRRVIGEIGVPEHIELDPIDGVISVWEPRAGVLEPIFAGPEFTSMRLRGTTFRVDPDTDEGIVVIGADGRPFEEPSDAMARADAAEAAIRTAGAAGRTAQAAAAQRIAALEAELRANGIEPPAA